jgi:hypothetical protein
MANGHGRVEVYLPLTLIVHKLDYDQLMTEIHARLLS